MVLNAVLPLRCRSQPDFVRAGHELGLVSWYWCICFVFNAPVKSQFAIVRSDLFYQLTGRELSYLLSHWVIGRGHDMHQHTMGRT